MKNQTGAGDQDAQQIRENPINQQKSITNKIKVNFWIISTVLLLIILLMSWIRFVFNTEKIISSNRQPTSAPSDQTNQIKVTGILRTSGLSDEEKQKFGLTEVNYQITDFGDYQKAYKEGQVMGYYLLSNDIHEELLGKCILVTGTTPSEWKNKNKTNTYNRLALNVISLQKLDYSNCNPYSEIPPAVDNAQEKLVLRGTVIHGKRPAPDIGYDYQLKLSKPFLDIYSPAGSPQKVSLIDATPSTNSIWSELENNINKEIEAEGYMVWGYAESKYLQITALTNQ